MGKATASPPSPAYSLRRRATVASLPFDVDKASLTVCSSGSGQVVQ
nr:hypothetical protein Iba_chr04dCG8240 [Ipomoea batatas]